LEREGPDNPHSGGRPVLRERGENKQILRYAIMGGDPGSHAHLGGKSVVNTLFEHGTLPITGNMKKKSFRPHINFGGGGAGSFDLGWKSHPVVGTLSITAKKIEVTALAIPAEGTEARKRWWRKG